MKIGDTLNHNGVTYTVTGEAPITNGADIHTDWMRDEMVDALDDFSCKRPPTFWMRGNLYVTEYKMFTNKIVVKCVYNLNPDGNQSNQKEIIKYLNQINFDNTEVHFDCQAVNDTDVECEIFYIDKIQYSNE